MRIIRVLALFAILAGLAPAVGAQEPTPISVAAVRHHGEGVDRVFEFDLANAGDAPVTTRGRLVVINVYDASLPVTIPVGDIVVPARGQATASVRWGDAPLVGQARVLLVLNDGRHASLVESRSFWIFPFVEAAAFAGIAAFVAVLTLGLMRLPKFLKTRVPSNMTPYVVEFDDTVVTLASRFDVSWQDIVRANRLKPPYELKEGRRILIPKHGLRRPGSAPDA